MKKSLKNLFNYIENDDTLQRIIETYIKCDRNDKDFFTTFAQMVYDANCFRTLLYDESGDEMKKFLKLKEWVKKYETEC